MSTSTSRSIAGRRFAYASSAARRRRSPCSGRTSAASNSGSPTGPLSTASAPRHAASVSSGSGSPTALIAAAPMSRSATVTSGATSSSTSRASRATSGPTPSPGRSTTCGLGILEGALRDRTRLAAARPRCEARGMDGGVPAPEYAADGLPRGVVLACLIPLVRERRPAVLAIPEGDRVHDRLRRPAEAGPRTGSHELPPSDSDTESLQDEVGVWFDEHGLQTVGDERRRLETVTRDEQHDTVVLAELALANGLAECAQRGRGRGLAEDARRLGEKLDVLGNVLLGDGMDRTAGGDCAGNGEVAVGRATDRDRARDRVRPHRLHARAVGERGRNRRAALGLAADQTRPRSLDEPELEQLAESPMELRVHRARGDRRGDRVRELPAELLGDLERQRLRPLRVVRAELDVHERPVELERELDAQPRAVVVAAVDGEDLRAVHGRGDELLRLEVGRNEDGGFDPLCRGARSDGIREVAGRRACKRRIAVLERRRTRHGDHTIFERVRRVGGVELQIELADADGRREAGRRDEWREPWRQPLLGRRRDRQERRVPPDAQRAGLDLLAGDGPMRVVDRLQRPEAARADSDRIEGHLRLADATAKCGGGHYSFSFRPWLGIQPGLAPRSVGAGCRGVTGPVPSASLDAEPDNVARLQP